MKQKRSCSNCIKNVAISVNTDLLCRINGAVSPDYVCSKHKFAPEPRTYKEMNYKCADCEFFTKSADAPQDMPEYGLCRMFSVRQYNGSQRSACSKFTKKKNRLEVS